MGLVDKNQHKRLEGRVLEVLATHLDAPLASGLYVTATPIGNLGDISLRALSVLARVDLIAAEDTRRSRTLLQHFGLEVPMLSYHDHNGAAQRPKLLTLLAEGKSVALISDAGTPLISDPGYKLLQEVRGAGFEVEVVPGASAVMAGLSLSGLPTDRFLFEGFLPPKSQARLARFEDLKGLQASLVFFETVKRVAAFLTDALAVLGDRQVALCRELTKLHEEVISGTISDVLGQLEERPLKGELVIVVGPPVVVEMSDADIETALEKELERGASMRDSVATVVNASDLPKKRVYGVSLKLKKRREVSGEPL